MNYYVVVEGKVDKQIYENWITYINPKIQKAQTLDGVDNDKFYIISGGGYPFYFEIISAAIEEINSNPGIFDRLVISVDSEDFSLKEKNDEIEEYITKLNCNIPTKIIVQHFCIETWGLGNIKIGPRNPKGELLKEYKEFFNVLINDPELLPPYEKEELNRAQFAYKYLRLLINDKHKNLTYTKNNPKAMKHIKFFNEVKNRHVNTTHISSFKEFLNAFV